MKKQYLILIFTVLILGLTSPFIDYVVVIQFMFLLLPMGLFLLGSFLYLVYCLIKKKDSIKKALITFSVIPAFLFIQTFAVFIMDKIQKNKSEELISVILKNKVGLPEKIETPLGIKYQLSPDKTYFTIAYYRGFMIREEYDSKNKEWKNYGLND